MIRARLVPLALLIMGGPVQGQSALWQELWHPAESEVQMALPCSRADLTHAAARGGFLAVSRPASHTVALYDVSEDHFVLVATIGGPGTNANQFNGPSGVAIDAPRRLLFVSDSNNHRVQVFRLPEPNKPPLVAFAKSIGRQGTAAGELDHPSALSLDAAGNLYVLDKGNARVQVFSAGMQPVRTFGNANELRNPLGIAATPTGDVVYVVDAGARRVQAFTQDGRLRSSLGKARGGDEAPGTKGSFFYPADVAVTGDGTAVVTDCGDHVVQRFATSGQLLDAWGQFGADQGGLNQPRAIAVDERDRVFILDFRARRAQIFTTTGTFVSAFVLVNRPTPKA